MGRDSEDGRRGGVGSAVERPSREGWPYQIPSSSVVVVPTLGRDSFPFALVSGGGNHESFLKCCTRGRR